MSIGERTKALILDVTYDAPAFKDVKEFRAAFDLAEKGAHEEAGKLFRDLAELIKYCAMVRSYLSERGANAHLRKEAGIPAGFERWYTEFRDKHDIAWAYKTMLHKIAEFEGGCEHCGRLTDNDADHKKSCILYCVTICDTSVAIVKRSRIYMWCSARTSCTQRESAFRDSSRQNLLSRKRGLSLATPPRIGRKLDSGSLYDEGVEPRHGVQGPRQQDLVD